MNAWPKRLGQTFALLLLGATFAQLPALADAPSRVALVVGNGNYEHTDKLANPITDARNMRDALRKIGFDVVYGEDLDKRSLERTIGQFAVETRQADVALVYYAGHGATFDDVAYVVPIDAQFRDIDQMPYELMPVETLIGEVRRAKGVRIAILDACRDNTAEKALKSRVSRGGEAVRGLARIKNPEGLILAYATQYLETAADGPPSGDSPFTAALLNNIGTPGLDVKNLFFKVGSEVIDATQGRQRPEISISFFGSYSLVDAPTTPETPVAAALPSQAPTPIVAVPKAPVLPPAQVAALPKTQVAPPAAQIAPPAPIASRPRPPPATLAAATPTPVPQAAAPKPIQDQRVAHLEPADPATEACDRLAAAPLDPKRPAAIPGVEFDNIDPALAVPTCRRAVIGAPSNPRLLFELARALQRDGSNDVDAAEFFRRAANAGQASAANGLGTLYRDGRGVPRNDAEAARLFRGAADGGSAYAMNNLGLMYEAGRGVPLDEREAVRWLGRAAAGGDVHAMLNVGNRYKAGRGLLPNDTQAALWFRKAADAGHPPAMNDLGTMYQTGRGVPLNPAQAVFWYRKAASLGNVIASDNLGVMYRDGRGVAKDLNEAIRSFRVAAEGGNRRAMIHLGDMIRGGRGLYGSDTDAANLYRKAADAGESDAMIKLGLMYQAGRGVPKDSATALRLFRQAASLGIPVAKADPGKPSH